MASHIEMKKLADSPAAVNALAASLLNMADVDWTEWEIDFLEGKTRFCGPDPLTTRQREMLFELRDNARSYTTFEGFSVASLLRECWLNRLDLSEDDEDFIVRLYAQGTTTLKRRPLFKLLRCARELDLIPGFVDVD